MTDRSDKWAIVTGEVEPARMEPGTKMYGIAQAGAMHAVIFTEFKVLADRIVDLLNQDGS